jgi:hypothetical protein
MHHPALPAAELAACLTDIALLQTAQALKRLQHGGKKRLYTIQQSHDNLAP